MNWYYFIAWLVVGVQVLFIYYAVRNYRYALLKYDRKAGAVYKPPVALIVPCKGLDPHFDANIRSLLCQDYENYRAYLVVQEPSDPAYAGLCKIRDELKTHAHGPPVEILVAGPSAACSQKIHNLLYVIDRLDDDVEVLAFADSDVCVRSDWLARLVQPLRRPKRGVTTGYRWFVPTRNNLATLGLSAINASVAQMLGNSRFNQAWGGSMAVRFADFRRLGLPEIWKHTLSDDLSLSRAIKKAGMVVTFVPACLVASYASMNWSRLSEFCRRQFLITRVYAPLTWILGLLSSVGSVLSLWGTAAVALYAARIGAPHTTFFVAVAVLCFAAQLIRVMLRQSMASRLLKDHAHRLRPVIVADGLGFWFWSLLLLIFILSSAFGRTIRWRGIRYRLLSPTETEVLGS
ncbi:MAG TPA: glycosyltransferase [Sedimentisphaerales bacterium]|nr:glycosyltransferase [Sedimentisphaerales bacterium]HRS13079.1 glycosyltransferase [Sedimentisphaerales bacterium]HRV49647.1 glycosyltransferase [Sedimentisphaerales bacterium]